MFVRTGIANMSHIWDPCDGRGLNQEFQRIQGSIRDRATATGDSFDVKDYMGRVCFPAWKASFCEKNIKHEMKLHGLVPWNPEYVLAAPCAAVSALVLTVRPVSADSPWSTPTTRDTT